MIRSFLIAGTILAVSLPVAASAQGSTRRGSCGSTSLSSYQDWFAIAAGVTCSASDAAQSEDLLSNGLLGGVSFYVSGPWDPVGFVPPTPNNGNTNSNSDNNSNTNNTNTPNLGCAPYVAKPWDPPGPPPAPCNNSNSNENNNTDPGTDENTTPPTDDVNLNSLVNEPNATPEPATLLLVASGLGGVGALARRRRAARNSTRRLVA